MVNSGMVSSLVMAFKGDVKIVNAPLQATHLGRQIEESCFCDFYDIQRN